MPAPGNSAWKRKTPKTAVPYSERVRRYRFGKFLKENREKFGMKATRTAAYMDVSIHYYWNLERGHANPPSGPTPWLPKLAKLFEVGIDEVYFYLGLIDPDLVELMGEHLWKYPDLASHIRKILATCAPNDPVIMSDLGEYVPGELPVPEEEVAQPIVPYIPVKRRSGGGWPKGVRRTPPKPESPYRFRRGRAQPGEFYDFAIGNEVILFLPDQLFFK